MTDRHFYKHRVTGVVAPLNDSFAAVFGDRFERVGAPSKDDNKNAEQQAPAPTPKAEDETPKVPAKTETPNTANTADAPKEGDK